MVVATFLAGGWIYGQSTPAATPQDKPPGVARISTIRGDVSIQRGDSADWVAAAQNTPVMPGDKVSTGQDALSELQLDYANILRLSSQSVANVTTLDNAQIQIQLAQGLAFYTILKGAEANAEIDTPNVALHPRGEGEFRIQVNPAGETVVMVRKGEADLSTSEGSTRVHKDQMITIHGTGADAQYQIAEAPSKDSWDKYNEDRDKSISSAQSWAHVDPYYTGAGDLDANGQWVNVPDYGWVWVPTVAPDWAPYRDGNWVWEPYYGWTWASYEPWGWAPYHYGRWFSYRNSWAWWPGSITRGYRPIWAPAYVSFFGFGAGRFGLSFGFGFGFGSIGWLPIGPCDPYFPWYGGFGTRFGFADLFRFHNHDYFRGYPGAFGPLAARFNERYSNLRMGEQDSRFLRGVWPRHWPAGYGSFRSRFPERACYNRRSACRAHTREPGSIQPCRQSVDDSQRARDALFRQISDAGGAAHLIQRSGKSHPGSAARKRQVSRSAGSQPARGRNGGRCESAWCRITAQRLHASSFGQ
jgi:hypothetical protein